MTVGTEKRTWAQNVAFWQPHIMAWQSSKLSVKSYCKENELNIHRFKYWRNQLIPKSKTARQQNEPMIGFLELTQPAIPVTAAAPTPKVCNQIEITTPDGFSIKVNELTHPDTLVIIFQTIKYLSC